MKNIIFNYSLFFFLIISSINVAFGQEETFYTQYYVNPILINSAYTGFNGHHNITANFRNRWSSFEGAPKAYTLIYDGAMTDNFGIGGNLWSETIGDIEQFRIGAKFAYKLRMDGGLLSIGFSGDYHRYSLDGDAIFNNPIVDITDEVAQRANQGLSFLDVGVGLYGELDNSFKFGLSLPNLIFTRINSVDPALIDDDSEDFFDSYFIFLGYEIDLPEQNFSIEPSVLFKKERLVPFHTDFNVRLNFLEDRLIGGLSYEVGAGDRFGILVGTRFSQIRLTYSYDLSFQDFQDYSSGSHELMLGLTLPKVGE